MTARRPALGGRQLVRRQEASPQVDESLQEPSLEEGELDHDRIAGRHQHELGRTVVLGAGRPGEAAATLSSSWRCGGRCANATALCRSSSRRADRSCPFRSMQHDLYFLPDPHGHGSLRPVHCGPGLIRPARMRRLVRRRRAVPRPTSDGPHGGAPRRARTTPRHTARGVVRIERERGVHRGAHRVVVLCALGDPAAKEGSAGGGAPRKRRQQVEHLDEATR